VKHRWFLPAFGVFLATAITSTMDALGPVVSAFSALPLGPLTALFWYWERLSWVQIGFVMGRARHYGLALLHPALVLGCITLTAWIAGAVNLEQTDWDKAAKNLEAFLLPVVIVLGFAALTNVVAAALRITKDGWPKRALRVLHVILAALLVMVLFEENFFRGWLWASLKRAGQGTRGVLIWTSLAFALWHWSAVLLDTGFNPPLTQVPVLMVNAALLGAIWGMMRLMSGSVVVASVAHSVWNACDYTFFAFGKKVGALGIHDSAFYGPEIGILGLVFNLAFAVGLWQLCKAYYVDDSGGKGVAPGGGFPLPART
jgi:membrane protease YdiL (CAAX protease family)